MGWASGQVVQSIASSCLLRDTRAAFAATKVETIMAIIALTCQSPDQSKPVRNLTGAPGGRARAPGAPCRVRLCVRKSPGASGRDAGFRAGCDGQPPGPSPLKFRTPRVPAPASPPRAILSRSGDAMALLGLGSSARGAPDEVHRSCSPAWACGPWSRPERTGAKRRTLALGRAPAPVWAIASVLARIERSRRMPGSADRFRTG